VTRNAKSIYIVAQKGQTLYKFDIQKNQIIHDFRQILGYNNLTVPLKVSPNSRYLFITANHPHEKHELLFQICTRTNKLIKRFRPTNEGPISLRLKTTDFLITTDGQSLVA
jgi:mRNA degradation ribonuclease J1/J2